MKKNLLFVLLIPGLLASCGECKHIDEDKNHICDICNMILSDHKDEDKNHLCDYCGQQLDDCVDSDLDGFCNYCGNEVELPFEYAEWPTKDIQDEVIVVSGSSVKIPEYRKADEIEINTDDEAESGYFSIYCYTENEKSEDEYKQILIDAGWDVDEEKDDNEYYNAWDSELEVWVNFRYDTKWSDLEICVTRSLRTKWPAQYIAESVQIIAPGSKTVIPEFEAYTTFATYYPQYRILAINASGYEDTIISDYKTTLESENWTVTYDDTIDEYVGISPNKDIKVQFYIEDDKGLFNVDVFSYTPPVKDWPYEQIAEVVADMGATGEILPYLGTFSGVTVDLNWADPVIIIDVPAGTEVASAKAYNDMLISKGYVVADVQVYGEDIYILPGTTLMYRGVYLNNGHNFTIEMFVLEETTK